jgi:hypothetical protein
MPGGLGAYGLNFGTPSFFGGNITIGVNNGSLATARVDDMVIRIMTPYFHLNQDQNFPTIDPSTADLNTFSPRKSWTRNFTLTGERSRDVRGNHAELIRRHGAAGAVLLKNTKGALPLKAPRNIAVFGNDAGQPTQSSVLNQANYEYGTLSAGGGSGTGQFTYLVTPLQAIQTRAKSDGGIVQYWLNNTLVAASDVNTLLIPRGQPDVCIVMLKTWAEEGADRAHLSVDWNGNGVVESVAAVCNNTIVVTHSSGVNTLPWSDHPNVTAILAAHFPGEENGNSLVDLLYGNVNPSGHLPYLPPLASTRPASTTGSLGSTRSSRLITATSTHRTLAFVTNSALVFHTPPSTCPTCKSPLLQATSLHTPRTFPFSPVATPRSGPAFTTPAFPLPTLVPLPAPPFPSCTSAFPPAHQLARRRASSVVSRRCTSSRARHRLLASS